MKLHYPKILLFCLLLNILAHNKNKAYITTHTPTPTSRVLIECNIYMPNYDNDPDMKSVKENFDRQTSQRFEEYDKRMIKNRQKCKEKCDKEIHKIILKDKMEKSFVEKVEKGCVKCGCGLAGVATSVGVLGTAVLNVLKTAAIDAAIGDAIADGVAAGEAARHTAGAAEVIAGLKTTFSIDKLGLGILDPIIDVKSYTNVYNISRFIEVEHATKCKSLGPLVGTDNSFCSFVETINLVQGQNISKLDAIRRTVYKIVVHSENVAEGASKTATEEVMRAGIKTNTAAVDSIYATCQTAIIASVVALLIIVLAMLIIYLILRYRRKKKMNKKLQYTKLLKE
ncbi:PIR protein, putative [Plasmodium sp. gorilla clade G1]|nr:PIR protein, putative [Plasmodium sp. gorilla clade G1]